MSNAISETIKLDSKLVNFKLSSESHPSRIDVNRAWVIDLNLPNNNTTAKILQSSYHHLKDIPLPNLHDTNVGILIGADMPHLFIQGDHRIGPSNQPVAVKLPLGWVVMGGKGSSHYMNTNFLTSSSDNENLLQCLKKFWEIDSYSTVPKSDTTLLSDAEQRSIQILQSTTKKVNGRYEVGLLWKDETPSLPYNRQLAVQRLKSTESKLQRQPEHFQKYAATIKDYLDKGHASLLLPAETDTCTPITNYIPHHGVTNPHKPGKVRVVFDASAQYNGTSLNGNLNAGPGLLNDLLSVLLKFREGRFAATADIEQMFHQILVRNEDRDALRFVWRDQTTNIIRDFKMNVQLFGKADSPMHC